MTGLITQGAKRIGSPEYVKSYKVASSDDGKTWRTYKVKGRDADKVRHSEMTEGMQRRLRGIFNLIKFEITNTVRSISI